MPYSMQQFMNLVEAQNNHFSWFKGSSLLPVIRHLGGAYDARRAADDRIMPPQRLRLLKIAMDRLPAAKRTKYRRALDYLMDNIDHLRELVAVHADGRIATAQSAPGTREGSTKYTLRWWRDNLETATGTFRWNKPEDMTGDTQAVPERNGMGTFMVHYQTRYLSVEPLIRSGAPEGEHAVAFRTRIGFRMHALGSNFGMEGDVRDVRIRTEQRCVGWTWTRA